MSERIFVVNILLGHVLVECINAVLSRRLAG